MRRLERLLQPLVHDSDDLEFDWGFDFEFDHVENLLVGLSSGGFGFGFEAMFVFRLIL
jgi:hypothetical protein